MCIRDRVSVCCCTFCPGFCTSIFRNRFLAPIAATKVCTDMKKPTSINRTTKDQAHALCEYADRLLFFMVILRPKQQIDFRMYRIDFCKNAFSMVIPRRKSKSTFHHPLGDYIIIKGLSRKVDPCLRTTLYRGPAA